MKKIFGSLFIKMVAFVLVCILCPILVFCAFFAAEAYDEGFYYGEQAEFESSDIALDFVCNNLAQVREIIYWNDIEGLRKSESYFDHPNFAYSIYDKNGKEILTTIKGNPEIHKPEDEGSEGYIEITSGYNAQEVLPDGSVVEEYEMTGYIIMPMQPDYGGYVDFVEYEFIYNYMNSFIWIGLGCFALCTLIFIYLMSCAGFDQNGEFELRGTNAVDIDILAGIYIGGVMFLIMIFNELSFGYAGIYTVLGYFLVLAAATAITLVMCMSITVHLRMKQGWKHTLIWDIFSICKRFFRFVMSNIKITWKLVLFALGCCAILFITGLLTAFTEGFFILVALFATVAITCVAIWFGSQLQKIKKGGEAIAGGDLDYRIESRELWPMLRGHAWNLNSAAVGMSKAVDDRLKSERFKTELITNVSHDLKTPLTSIVSYVDLLKKEDIQNENALGYIEVLDRQSQKLKKLTEDLVEASKASSGAVNVNYEVVDIGELINQSVGEFSEKLAEADIYPVINLPENDICCYTDGRLLWRVFDNLIQNIIKYAQPGTRAYFDLSIENEEAILTIRNISKEPLNMTADELMERFVRGDASRNSEGNGLGLSISRSLTELCGGKFSLTLDGDLYKIVITLRNASERKTPAED